MLAAAVERRLTPQWDDGAMVRRRTAPQCAASRCETDRPASGRKAVGGPPRVRTIREPAARIETGQKVSRKANRKYL
jgi:hypothetical protein